MRSTPGTRLPSSVMGSLDELAKLGAGPQGGVTRVAWSTELFAAYAWVGERMRELGLNVEIDEAGNLIGRWGVTIVVFGILRPDTFLTTSNLTTIFGSQAILVVITLALLARRQDARAVE
jgi:hypothetical protein